MHERISTNKWQRGCPELIADLTARPVWYSPALPDLDPRLAWVAALEARFEDIRREVLALRTAEGVALGFQQYRTPKWTVRGGVAPPPLVCTVVRPPRLWGMHGVLCACVCVCMCCMCVHVCVCVWKGDTPSGSSPPTVGVPGEGASTSTASAGPGHGGGSTGVALGTDRGDWNVYYLQLHNADYEANRARCPVTAEVLGAIPRSYQHSFFSAVAPGTHITPHTGPTNKKLRCHLPLIVPPGGLSRIRVGDDVVVFEEGKCFVFDDSFEHEVWNDAGGCGCPVCRSPFGRPAKGGGVGCLGLPAGTGA